MTHRKETALENLISDRRPIGDGVWFTSVTDAKFKINRISVNFVTLLSRDAAKNALLPRILARCTNKLNTMQALNKRLEGLYSASLNSSVRSEADYQVTEMSVSVLGDRYALDGEPLLEEVTRILLDCIFDPFMVDGAFDKSAVETERQNLKDDNDAEINDKAQYAHEKAYEEAFRGEPAEIRSGGLNEDVDKVTMDDLLSAHKAMLENLRTEIICVGVGDFSGAENLFREAFSRVKRSPAVLPGCILSQPKAVVSRIVENMDVEQSKLVMFFKSPLRDRYALMVMSALYGGTESSKLFTVVREQMSLCYYCYSRGGYTKGYLSAEAGVDSSNLEKAEAECLNQLRAVAEGDFTDEEVNKVKLYLTNSIRSSCDSVGGISSRCFMDIIFPDIANSIEEMIERVNAVTREEITEAAASMKLDTVYTLTP